MGIERAYERNADRSTDRGEQEDTEVNQGQGLQPQERQDVSPQGRSARERSTNIFDQRPLCVGFSETDRYAQAVYEHNFPGRKNYGDITTINPQDLPDFDLFCGGFPCQSFSVAGKRRGFDDTRGTLFFDIARLLRAKQPRYVLLENVKGLLSHDNGSTFKTIIATLVELGYGVEWQVLNAKDFGVPQNRERVFIVGHLGGFGGQQVFPLGSDDQSNTQESERPAQNASTLQAGYGKAHGGDTYIKENSIVPTIRATEYKHGDNQTVVLDASYPSRVREYPETAPTVRDYGSGGNKMPLVIGSLQQHARVSVDGIVPTLNSAMGMGGGQTPVVARQPLRYLKRNQKNMEGDYAFTVDASQTSGVRLDHRIRRLTPIECERLMGLPDGWTKYGLFNGEAKPISDTQRYKLCGNGVVVNCVEAIINKLTDTSFGVSL